VKWRTVLRRIFIVCAIIAIPVMGYLITLDVSRRGSWKSIIQIDPGAPPGTTIPNADFLPEINFAQLKTYRFFEGKGTAPEGLKQLDGQLVQLKGYPLQPLRGDKVRDFRIVGDLLQCCFGGEPLINSVVKCEIEQGKSFPYKISPHRIVGHFSMEEVRDEDGELVGLFKMKVYDVQRLKR